MEKHREMQKEVQIAFVDLETAYDIVPRQELLFGGVLGIRVRVSEKYERLVND